MIKLGRMTKVQLAACMEETRNSCNISATKHERNKLLEMPVPYIYS
jgi:hypothetical protein